MKWNKIPFVFHPIYSQLSLPANHRFPIEKYQALKDAAFALHAPALELHLVAAPVATDLLYSVHESQYVDDFVDGKITPKAMKRIGFPWSEQFVKRTRTAVAGTLLAAELAVNNGVAINGTGGYHHAFPDLGSGFCVFNDLVLAAKQLLQRGDASRVLIFDCDVHQGDGSAVCAQESTDIFTLSIHCEKNFPARKQQSDWDLGLDKHIKDQEYLNQVAYALDAAVNSFRPDFIIYDAGVDVHENDDLGLLNVTTSGIFARDRLVMMAARQLDIPILAVIGGGYQRDIACLTRQHMQLIDATVSVFAPVA